MTDELITIGLVERLPDVTPKRPPLSPLLIAIRLNISLLNPSL